MSTLGDDYSQALKAGAGGLQSRSELDLTANHEQATTHLPPGDGCCGYKW